MDKTNTESLSAQYLKSLDEKELIAYNIAKGHLGSQFTLEKSNHYLEWLRSKGPSVPKEP